MGDMFENQISEGVSTCSARWMAETARSTYQRLKDQDLSDGRIEEAIETFNRLIKQRTWPNSP